MPDPSASKGIITGGIQSGKSTVIRAVMAQLGWREPSGFFTHWGGRKRPAPELFMEPWTGGAHVMARPLPERTGPDGLPYALDVDSFRETARASLVRAGKGPVAVDELGVLELGATEFCTSFCRVFRGPAPALVVIQERALARWQALIDPGQTAPVFTVTPANREKLPAEIVRAFRS